MRKFLFLFLTTLCLLVTGWLNAQTLTITPKDGGYVNATTGVSSITFEYTDGIALCTNVPSGYGQKGDWQIPIYDKDNNVVAVAEYYGGEYGGVNADPTITDDDGNVIGYPFTLYEAASDGYDPYSKVILETEGTYYATIPKGFFLLGSKSIASSAVNYEFTIGEGPNLFDLSFILGDYSDAAHSVQVIFEGADNLTVAGDKTITVTGDATLTANAVQGTDNSWYIQFSSSLKAGQYTITIPEGYFEDNEAKNAKATATYTKSEPEAIVGLGDVVWTFDEGKEEHSATISKDGIISALVAIGDSLSYYNTEYIVSNNTKSDVYGKAATFTLIQPSFVDDTHKVTNTTAEGKNAVDFILNIKNGCTFTPTSISFYAVGCGTDGGNIDATWYASDTDEGTSLTQLVGKTSLARDKNNIKDADNNTIYSEEDFTLYESTEDALTNISASTGSCKLRINIYGLTNNKQAGLSNIVITGTIVGPKEFAITLEPDGEEVKSISSIKVTPAEGYTISSVDETLAITLTATIEETEVSYSGTATIDEATGAVTITFAADEEGNAITTAGEYTLNIPEGYFVTEDGAISEETTATYTVVAPIEPESIGLLDEVDTDVFAITKDSEWYAANGFDGSEGSYYKLYDEGVIFYENDNITIETATSTYVNTSTSGNQLGSIQAEHPTYTAFINFGSGLDEINEQTTDPTEKPGNWQGMLKVTPTVDGGLTFNVHAGTATRTFGVYNVAAEEWVNIVNQVTGDVTVYTELEANKEYLLVAQGTNSNLYQIAFPSEEPVEVEPGPEVEDEVIYTTDFTDWTDLSWEDSNGVVVDAETTTGEEFTFTLWGVQVDTGDVTQWNSDDDGNHTTPKFEGEGALIFAKYAEDGSSQYSTCEPYVLTSTISSVTKITFTEGVTGSNRGVKISVKGDGDDDWVEVFNTSINSGSTEEEVEINRTNCQIKIESISVTQNTYVLDFTIYGVVEEEPVEGELLYSTDFTDWETIDRSEANGEEVTVTTTTDGELTFTLWGVGVDPTKTDESKFPDYVGAMITAKYAEDGTAEYSVYEPFAVTSTLGTVDKIVFTQVATGNNRGIKVSVKGDGDEDWVVIHNETIHTASGETIELDVNKTNCRIKFESFALAQNGYIADLKIYGTDATSETEDPDKQLYEDIKIDVDALGVDLTYAWANINLEYPESVEGLQSTYDAISVEITNLQLVVEASHDGEELTTDKASIEAQVAIIKAEIDALTAAAASINSITIDNNFEGKSIYTISGQKVSAPTKAGIYIIDGKKVVIK